MMLRSSLQNEGAAADFQSHSSKFMQTGDQSFACN
jgi:hypothetical protein